MDLSEASELERLGRTDSAADVLRRARALIADEAKWCCHAAEDGDRKCLIMTIQVAGGYHGQPAGLANEASCELFGEPPSIANRRGHAAAMRILDRAILLAESR